jgi:hypothetical protein
MPTDPNSKAAFVLYYSHWSAIKILPDEKLGRLIRSIYEHELNGTPVDLTDDPQLNMAYSFMRIQLDYDRVKWENTRMERSKAGKESGRARRAKSKQQKHMFDSTNKDEQNDHLFDSPNYSEQNEHTKTLSSKTNNDVHNVNVDVYENGNVKDNGDDGDDDRNKTGTSSTTISTSSAYDFWDFYPVMFFMGFKNPVQVTKECVRYYEDQNWTLRGGRKLLTLDEKVKKARKWVPKDPSLKSPRTDMDFLAQWAIIWGTMKKEGAPEKILKAALDERIRAEINDSLKTMTIYLPQDVVNYIEKRSSILNHLISFRIERGMSRIEYLFLNKTSMAKYTL